MQRRGKRLGLTGLCVLSLAASAVLCGAPPLAEAAATTQHITPPKATERPKDKAAKVTSPAKRPVLKPVLKTVRETEKKPHSRKPEPVKTVAGKLSPPKKALTKVVSVERADPPDQAVTPEIIPQTRLQVLTEADTTRYREIFTATRKGDIATADRLLSEVQNRILVGHALRLRLIADQGGRPAPEALHKWLATYSDEAGSDEVRALLPASQPAQAMAGQRDTAKISAAGTELLNAPVDILPSEEYGRIDAFRALGVRSVAPSIASALRDDRPDDAVKMLDEPNVGGKLDDTSQDIARADVANYFYMAGDDKTAFEMATAAFKRSGEKAPQAAWTAGLAAWRMKQPDVALGYFDTLTTYSELSVWTVAAAAFWAARADIATAHPERVMDHLEIAARYPQTFYGLMASRLLGRDIAATPDVSGVDKAAIDKALNEPAVTRAVALARIGEPDLASAELGLVRADLPPTETAGIDAVAARLGLIDVAAIGSGRYPVPEWRPSNGLKIDRALLFAYAKQESGLNARALSPAGAVGLMQLMPATARIVANQTGLPLDNKRNNLNNPTVNLSLGQAYLAHLMDDGSVGDNLFFLAAAYNAGPGNLQRWADEVRYNDDPLLFIESIPAGETRLFIERILANFWIYQARLGQSLATLDAAAAGRWPVYKPQDSEVLRNVSQNYARN